MTNHTRSIWFTILTSICNIIITLVLVGSGYLCASYIALSLGLAKNGEANYFYKVLVGLVLFFTLIGSLKIYMVFARWIIRVFKLDGKLDQKILDRYSENNENTL